MSEFALAILLSLSSVLGIESVPDEANGWQVQRSWVTGSSDYLEFSAESGSIPVLCRQTPDMYVNFPMVVHGAHQILIDRDIVLKFGDPTFASTRSFFGAPSVSCKEFVAGSTVTWTVTAYSRYFARIPSFPTIGPRSLHNSMAETGPTIGTGIAWVMGLFFLTLFYGRATNALVGSVFVACIGSSVYFMFSTASFFSIDLPMLTAHRIADLGVWIGMTSLFYSLVEQGLLSRRLMLGFSALSFLGMLVIFAGRNGDDIQFGTSIPFGGAVAVLVVALFNAFQRLDRVNIRSASSRLQVLQLLALTSFILACFYEISVVTGVLNSSPLLPFGLLSGVFFLTLSVNEKITSTYLERDYLRKNLQKEVDKKTSELQRQTIELEQTMRSLRSTQAELVQSAKLASLGTLSAGIAHEINNSLNYVNGGLQPLVRILEKSLPETERSRADKLVGVMRDGLQLTMEIIKSLRAYTGLNQAKFNDVNLKQVVDTSLTILRNKTRGSIHTSVEVNPDIKVFGSVVGLNQVFMNLFSNAIDAMPNGGTLRIAAQRAPLDAAVTGERSHSEPNGDWVRIEVEDTGQGMPASVRERIFEPFFTTKEVGRGTGLGLHIVRTEIERHGGRLTVTSEEGKGTRFTIELPTLGQQAQTLARTELNAGPTQRSEAA